MYSATISFDERNGLHGRRVVFVEYAFAELTEVLRRRKGLVSIGLHEQGEGLPRYVLCAFGGRPNSNAVRRRSQFASRGKFERFPRLERQAVIWDGDLCKVASAVTYVQPRGRRRGLDNCGRSIHVSPEIHGLFVGSQYQRC
jgi:hypothetical protein